MDAVSMTATEGGSSESRGSGSQRLRSAAERAAAAVGLELVHLTYRKEGRGWMLRIYVDRAGGVTLDDCARASDQLGALLEVEDIIPHSYTLEVSSPGLDRPLLGEQDYRRFTGHRARIKTHQPLGGRRNFAGVLAGWDEGRVLLDSPDGDRVVLPVDIIASARLDPVLDAALPAPPRDRDGGAGRKPKKEKVRE